MEAEDVFATFFDEQQMSGSGADGGFDFQADVIAFVAVHMLAGHALEWFDDFEDVPILIAAETDGPGDDLSIQCKSGLTVEVQVKKGLSQNSDFRKSMTSFGTGLQADSELRGVLLVDPSCSSPIQENLRNELLRGGRTDGAKEIMQNVWQIWSEVGVASDALIGRLRVVVKGLDTGQEGRAASITHLANMLTEPNQAVIAWDRLGKMGHQLIKRKGQLTKKTLVDIVQRHCKLKSEFLHAEPVQNGPLAISSSVPSEPTPEPISLSDAELASRFAKASEPLSTWPQTLDGNRWIDRPELESVFNRFEEDKSTTLLLGEPGSGKSALLAKIHHALVGEGKFVLSIKADVLPTDVGDDDSLAKFLRLPASVQECVKAIATSNPCFVLVDQLDALGDLSDLHSGRLGILLQTISGLSNLDDVHIVASCRSFEYRYDSRLSTINAEEIDLPLPDWDKVASILNDRQIDASRWSASCQQVLRVPQHLKVFLQFLNGESEQAILDSYQSMLDHLWDKVILRGESGNDRSKMLHDLAERIADSEQLWQPLTVWEERRKLVDQLIADGVLTTTPNGKQVGFQHQSLFDHARARMFATGGIQLTDFVLARQNGLFVRPTLWSALHYLRESNQVEYQTATSELMGPKFRSHIKHLVVEFFAQVDNPTAFELRLIQPFLTDRRRHRFLRLISGNPGWFDLLQQHYLRGLMEFPIEELASVGHLLSESWDFASERIWELLDENWLAKPTHDQQSLSVLSELAIWDEEAVNHVVAIAERSSTDHGLIMQIASIVSHCQPNFAPRIVEAMLARLLRELNAKIDPPPPSIDGLDQIESYVASASHQPKQRYVDLIRRHDNLYDLPAIAEASPEEFLERLWPWFVQLIERLLDPPETVLNKFQSCHRAMYDFDRQESKPRPIFEAVEVALSEMAKCSPGFVKRLINAHGSSEAKLIQRILCDAVSIIATTDAEFAVRFLEKDRRRFFLGSTENNHQETCYLLSALGITANDDQLRRLETAIKAWSTYRPEVLPSDGSYRLKRMKWDREHRLRLWRSLPLNRLSQEVQSLILAEQIALPDFSERDSEGVQMRALQSPMSAKQLLLAKDDHIIRMLDSLSDPVKARIRDFDGGGGMTQIAQEFGRLAVTNGRRVASVLRKLNPEKHFEPVCHAIDQLGGSELSTEELISLIVHLSQQGFNSDDFRASASRSLCNHVGDNGLPNKVLSMLRTWLDNWTSFDYHHDGETDDENHDRDDAERTKSILWGSGGLSMLPHGSYWVIRAISTQYIRIGPSSFGGWLDVLERHLEKHESNYTWRCCCDLFRNLVFNANRGRARNFVHRLFESDPAIKLSREGAILAATARTLFDDDVDSDCEPNYEVWLRGYENSESEIGPQIFGELLGLSYVQNEFESWIPDAIDASIAAYTAGTAKAAVVTGISHTIGRNLPELIGSKRSIDLFIQLIALNDGRASRALAQGFNRNKGIHFHGNTERLLMAVSENETFIRSAISTRIIDTIEPLTGAYPTEVGKIAHEITDLIIGDSALRPPIDSGEGLVKIANTLQRTGTEFRETGLVLFEKLFDAGLGEARSMLTEIDNRPNMIHTRPAPKRRSRR